MDSLLAPGADGNYHTYFGKVEKGLFVHRVEEERYLFRHQGSGHSLFFFLGDSQEAHRLLTAISSKYDFCRDSTWVLKGLSEIHALLVLEGLSRAWLHRSWHYSYGPRPPDWVAPGLAPGSSHTTVRTVPYTAVHTTDGILPPGVTP